MLLSLLGSVCVLAIVAVASVLAALAALKRVFFKGTTAPHKFTIAFFHPYCHAGGGGERVLWCAIASLADVYDKQHARFVVYTGDVGITAAAMRAHVMQRFGIDLSGVDLTFIYVTNRAWLEASRYPRFTMLGQSLGSMLVAWQALRLYQPDVFVDTTGCAFTFVIAKVFTACRVAAYVHYPTITTDMMARVHARRPTYNNASDIVSSNTATTAKLLYYRLFAALYRMAGAYADVIITNSSWTRGHLVHLWGLPEGDARSVALSGASALQCTLRALELGAARPPAITVFPPCNTAQLTELAVEGRARTILSIAQFRPEKDHFLQLEAFAQLRARGDQFADVRLIMAGGVRSAEDEALVERLLQRAQELHVAEAVDIRRNVPLPALQAMMGSAMAGLHTMWNEHFGIGVVEMMAAGMCVVAHASGGPLADIVVPYNGRATGFLATTPSEYADQLERVFNMSELERADMVSAARASVQRFSDEAFRIAFFSNMIGLVDDSSKAARARRRLDHLVD